jgi:chromosomal replication initiator protein
MSVDGADVVDHVTEIPLPGRMLSGTSVDGCAALPRVSLGSFVAGPENRLAASSINRLLQADRVDGVRANASVLAIHGASGTGKTHLARGLVRTWQERGCASGNDTDGKGAQCAEYFTAADFRHALADAIKADTVGEYRQRLRGLRLLAIDDVDRLPSDAYIQQELRYTIDALGESGAMIVVTLSSPLSAARNLSADVRSRLVAGLELQLAPPDKAARQRLAHHVSAAIGRPLSPLAAHRLAAGVVGTAGDVFGAVFELNAVAPHSGGNDLGAVEQFLANRAARRPAIRDILQAVAKYYQLPQKVLKSSSRRQSAVSARAMAVYLARELAGLSYERIGNALGGRDHSTIMHNYRNIVDRLTHDGPTRDALAELQRNLSLTT